MRTSLKNKIHALLTRFGYEIPFTDAFGVAGIKHIKSLEWKEPIRSIVFKYLGLIEGFNEEINKIDKILEETVKETEEMRLLKSIPGIGKVTAYLIASETGPIDRFFSYKKYVSYSGLVPGMAASAGKTRFKRSKERNKYLQWAFIEAAIPAIRQSPILLAKYTRIAKKKDNRKAKMTVARKLAEAAYKVLSQRREYQEGITIRKINSL